MTENPRCSLCGKRKPERFCPALGEKICAVCCGTAREVTLDCPTDCPYLISAHRYELEHRAPLAETEIPFRSVKLNGEILREREPLLAGVTRAILQFAAERPELADPDVLAAFMALAETYRTLSSGIYYAKAPDAPMAAALYAALDEFFRGYKEEESKQAAFSTLKDAEVFQLLVFLARVARSRANMLPRSRIFLEFLRVQFPPQDGQPVPEPQASRIIIP